MIMKKNEPNVKELDAKEPDVKKPNVIEDADCWRCKDCGAEWSFLMSDNEVPEICPYCLPEDTE